MTSSSAGVLVLNDDYDLLLLWWFDNIWSLLLEILLANARPFVSKGSNNAQIAAVNAAPVNRASAVVWWHPWTKPTATRGQIIPPILPIELPAPTPVLLSDVGYIYIIKFNKHNIYINYVIYPFSLGRKHNCLVINC